MAKDAGCHSEGNWYQYLHSFLLGHRDLEWISIKLEQEGWFFWSDTFRSFSMMAKAAEFDTKIWSNVALVGGGLFEKIEKNISTNNRIPLSIQNDLKDVKHLPIDTSICKILLEKGIYTISELHAREESRYVVVVAGKVYKTSVVLEKWGIDGCHVENL